MSAELWAVFTDSTWAPTLCCSEQLSLLPQEQSYSPHPAEEQLQPQQWWPERAEAWHQQSQFLLTSPCAYSTPKELFWPTVPQMGSDATDIKEMQPIAHQPLRWLKTTLKDTGEFSTTPETSVFWTYLQLKPSIVYIISLKQQCKSAWF